VPTNLAIDDARLHEAKILGGHRTKRDAVNSALREYVRHLKLRGLIDLFGKVEFNDYDDKKARRAR